MHPASYAAGWSDHPVTAEAVGAALADVLQAGVAPDLALVVAAPPLVDTAQRLEPRALAVFAAWTGDVDVTWAPPGTDTATVEGDAVVVLAADEDLPLTMLLTEDRPATGGVIAGGARFLVDGALVEGGTVLLGFTGDAVVGPASAIALEPIGPRHRVTGVRAGHIAELDGRPAAACIESDVAESDAESRHRMRRGIDLVVTGPDGAERGVPVVGIDRSAGVVATQGLVTVGDDLCLAVRDGFAAAGAFAIGEAAGFIACVDEGAQEFVSDALDEVLGIGPAIVGVPTSHQLVHERGRTRLVRRAATALAFADPGRN